MSMSNDDNTMRTGRDRTSVGLECPPESRTKQEFRAECDINNVVAHHAVTGQFTHVAASMPTYGDFSSVEDYQEASNQILQADLAFAQLPAAVRARMSNSPEVFLEFMADPDNQEEAVKLGLADAPPAPHPDEVPSTDPEPEPRGETPPD